MEKRNQDLREILKSQLESPEMKQQIFNALEECPEFKSKECFKQYIQNNFSNEETYLEILNRYYEEKMRKK